jgi:hypothetical protein
MDSLVQDILRTICIFNLHTMQLIHAVDYVMELYLPANSTYNDTWGTLQRAERGYACFSISLQGVNAHLADFIGNPSAISWVSETVYSSMLFRS